MLNVVNIVSLYSLVSKRYSRIKARLDDCDAKLTKLKLRFLKL